MTSVFPAIPSCLKSPFLGESSGLNIRAGPLFNKISYRRKAIECKESRIGKQPISIPSNVNITLEDEGQQMTVKGPMGELSRVYPRDVKLVIEESGILKVIRGSETKRAYQMQGLFRTLTDNMLVGVSKGFEKRLQLVGVGYRATLDGKDLVLNLGFSHPVRMTIPDELKVKVEENTRIIISGYDKCAIGEFAASVRRWRPPEPYKGKGIRYADEVIKLKPLQPGGKKK